MRVTQYVMYTMYRLFDIGKVTLVWHYIIVYVYIHCLHFVKIITESRNSNNGNKLSNIFQVGRKQTLLALGLT